MRNYFRVVIPRQIDEFLKLSQNIVDCHLQQGAASVLSDLDMSEMLNLNNEAQTLHALFKAQTKDKEVAFQERNLALGLDRNQFSYTPDTVLYYVCCIRDYLFGVFKGREHSLGNWGYNVNSSNGFVSVIIPKKADKLIELAELINEKHLNDDSNTVLKHFNMTRFAELISLSIDKHTLAKHLNRDKEMNFEQRNLNLGFGNGKRDSLSKNLLHYVLSVRDILLGLNKGNEKSLGKWGFEVNNTPRKKEKEANVSISGHVKEENNESAISNASVKISLTSLEFSTQTDELGNFHLEFYMAQPEQAMMLIEATNYQIYSKSISLKPNDDLNLEVDLGGEG